MRLVFTFLAIAAAVQAQQRAATFGQITTQPNITPTILPAPGQIVTPSRGAVQPPPPPQHSDCAIDGYVVNSITGEPIPRAQVALAGPYGQPAMSADNSGRWAFTNVACATVQIMATRPGFLMNYGNRPAGTMAPMGLTRPMTLTSGSPVHDFKILLMPQSVVTGKVLDDQGDPVMNAQINVLASRVVEGRRMWQPASGGNTNDLGEFRLASLAPGKYLICARSTAAFNVIPLSPRGETTVMGESCYPGPIEGSAAGGIDLPPGRDTRVDFTLHLVPAVHVRGVISGVPKNQHAGVSLMRRGSPGVPGINRPAIVDPEGKFDISGVTPGSYMASTDSFDGTKRLTARVPVEVGGVDVDGVTVHLEPGFSITVNMRVESKNNTASPSLQSLGLHLAPTEPMIGGGRPEFARDAPSVTFLDLSPGEYRLQMFGQGQFFMKSALLGGRDISREAVPITQSAGPVEVVISDEGGTVEAQVSNADDQPVASSVLLLGDGRAARIAQAGPNGHVKLAGLAPGDYIAYAWDDIQQVEYGDPGWMRQNGRGGVSVSVAADQTTQITLKQQIAPAQ